MRAFGQERQHLRRFRELNDENRDANMTTVRLNAAYFPAVELLSALVTVEILVIGGIEAINGHTSTGVVFAFIAALNNFFDPIQQLSQLYTTYQSGMAALDKIFGLLDEQPEIVDAPDAIELPPIDGELRFDGVSFRYGAEADSAVGAARHRPRRARRARRWPWSGRPAPASRPSPSSWPASMTRPRASISVDGHDLRSVTAQSLRSQMGMVPQEGFLFSGTVRENIAFGRPGATDERGPRRRPRGRAPTTSSWRCRTATTPRSASAACSCPPASASSSPSPARWWPIRGSWCSTRRPPTSTCTPRA